MKTQKVHFAEALKLMINKNIYTPLAGAIYVFYRTIGKDIETSLKLAKQNDSVRQILSVPDEIKSFGVTMESVHEVSDYIETKYFEYR